MLGLSGGVRTSSAHVVIACSALCLSLGATACTGTENQLFGPDVPAAGGPAPKPDAALPDAHVPGIDARVLDPLDAAVVLRNQGLDPDADFDWTQTPPGKGTCDPGTYTGSFTCKYANHDEPIVGSIELMLDGSSESPTLTATGHAIGFGTGQTAVLMVNIEGALDCGTHKLDGDAKNDPLNAPWSMVKGGKLMGELDATALELSGEITLSMPLNVMCSGTWSATGTRP